MVTYDYTYTHQPIGFFIPSLYFQFTDRGIIMTFGSGSNGCLGHSNFNDVTQVACITQQHTVHNVGSLLEISAVQCNAAIIFRGVSTVLFTYFILMKINGN